MNGRYRSTTIPYPPKRPNPAARACCATCAASRALVAVEVRCLSRGAFEAGVQTQVDLDLSSAGASGYLGEQFSLQPPVAPVVNGDALELTGASTFEERAMLVRLPPAVWYHFELELELYVGDGTGGEGMSVCMLRDISLRSHWH